MKIITGQCYCRLCKTHKMSTSLHNVAPKTQCVHSPHWEKQRANNLLYVKLIREHTVFASLNDFTTTTMIWKCPRRPWGSALNKQRSTEQTVN